MISRGSYPMRMGSSLKKSPQRDTWKDPLCLSKTASIILCGPKGDGQVQIIVWLMPLQIHLWDRLNELIRSSSNNQKLPQEQDITASSRIQILIIIILYINAGLKEKLEEIPERPE